MIIYSLLVKLGFDGVSLILGLIIYFISIRRSKNVTKRRISIILLVIVYFILNFNRPDISSKEVVNIEIDYKEHIYVITNKQKLLMNKVKWDLFINDFLYMFNLRKWNGYDGAEISGNITINYTDSLSKKSDYPMEKILKYMTDEGIKFNN